MGTEVHLIVVGGRAADLDAACARIEHLERIWSRFLPDSEISALNSSAGTAVPVSAETMELLRLGLEGRAATGGLFDPTMLGAMVAIGYDRDFDRIADGLASPGAPPGVVPGTIELDPSTMTARLVSGSGFDPGGIGKGYAADIVAGELRSSPGVRGVCVNIGGDLRVAGEGPGGGAWLIEVEHPLTGEPAGVIALEEGAVATTSRTRRRWMQAGEERHHLVDPRTGLPVRTGLASVTVVAGEAWWAEVAAKACFLAGAEHADRVAREAEIEGVATRDDGSTIHLGRDRVLIS
jgi:FAD:protein FMN transferase